MDYTWIRWDCELKWPAPRFGGILVFPLAMIFQHWTGSDGTELNISLRGDMSRLLGVAQGCSGSVGRCRLVASYSCGYPVLLMNIP